MWFQVTFTVPAERGKDEPYPVVLPVSAGTLSRVVVRMCPGAHKTCGVQIKWLNQVIWPLNPDEWIELDEWPLEFGDEFEITPPPSHLTILGHAEDAKYNHEVTVGVEIRRKGLPGLLESFMALFSPARPVEI